MSNGTPVCIECGGSVNALNEDENGDPCRACAERLLETLPGVFHAPWGQEEHGVEEIAATHVDDEPLGTPPDRPSRSSDSFGEPRGSA